MSVVNQREHTVYHHRIPSRCDMKRSIRTDSSSVVVLSKKKHTAVSRARPSRTQQVNNYDRVTIMKPVLETNIDPAELSALVRDAMKESAKRK